MKSRVVTGIALACLAAGVWALPASGDESYADPQGSYYLRCINDEIDSNSCQVALVTSRSKNLQAYGERAALRAAFLSKNREVLVQEMVAQKVSLRPQAVQQYLRQRFNQAAHGQAALHP